jgi:hypothetical protein
LGKAFPNYSWWVKILLSLPQFGGTVTKMFRRAG